MFLSTRERTNGVAFGNTVLVNQPFRSGRIDERHVDLVTVLSAELLKGSVRDERIEDLQLAFADEALHLGNGKPQQIGRAFPGIRIVLWHYRADSVPGEAVDEETFTAAQFQQKLYGDTGDRGLSTFRSQRST